MCVYVKVAKWVDQKGRSAWRISFFGSVCSLRAVAANENKRREYFLSHKIYFHGTTTTTRRKAAEMLAIEIASLGVNNLKIVTKVGL